MEGGSGGLNQSIESGKIKKMLGCGDGFWGFLGVLKCDESQIHDLGRREGGALVISGDFCDFLIFLRK